MHVKCFADFKLIYSFTVEVF